MTEPEDPKFRISSDSHFRDILKNPILDIAARFWEEDRYRAFKTCYRSMRFIDDLVDNRKATGRHIISAEREHLSRQVGRWIDSIRGRQRTDECPGDLLRAMETFQVPVWPWERLAEAMMYDLAHDSYPTWRVFRRYCEGAAVAPASVFMHLCAVDTRGDTCVGPTFDVRAAARPLALFSYLVHIIRDFQRDQRQHLNYFAQNLLRQHRLTVSQVRSMAQAGRISFSLRNLISQYAGFAEHFRRSARVSIDRTARFLAPRYRLSLEIIYSLYSQIHERIDPTSGTFAADELNPGPEEVRRRLDETVAAFQLTSRNS